MYNLADYEPVEVRLERFIKEYPDFRIATELEVVEANRFIVKTYLFKNATDSVAWATGYAEERVTATGATSTSALEVCETSSIGRALANAGYSAKGKRPSREEMIKVAPNHPALTVVPDSIDIDYWNTSFKNQAVITEIVNTELDIPSCVHGAMLWQTGVSQKNGKEWARMTCQSKGQTGGMEQCPPIWYNIGSDGKWKPQKVRV